MTFKDSWQKFLTKIDDRIPIKKLTTPLDKKFALTSFFIFLIIILAVLYLIFGSLLFSAKPSYVDVTIKLADNENNILDNFDFKIRNLSDGTESLYKTNQQGSFKISLDRKKLYFIVVESVGYKAFEQQINFESENFNYVLELLEVPANFPKTIYFQDALTEQRINDNLNVTIVCESGEVVNPSSTDVLNGSLSLEIPTSCNALFATITGDRYNESRLEIPLSEQFIRLNPKSPAFDVGTINVSVLSSDLFIEESITLRLFSIDDPVTAIDTVQTNYGVGIFDSVKVGEYILKASDITNRYLPGEVQVQVLKNKLSEVIINLIDSGDGSGSVIDPDTNQEIFLKEINVYLKDKVTGEMLDSTQYPVVTLLLDSNENIDQRTLTEGFTFKIDENKSYSLKAEAQGYLPEILPVYNTQTTYIFNLEKITIDNVSEVFVNVEDEDNKPIIGIKVWIYDSLGQYIDPRFNFSVTDQNGLATFENIPDLNFTIKVKNEYIEQTSQEYYNNPPEDTNITLPVEIGKGTINLTIKNNLNDVISDSLVTFYSETGEVLGSVTSSLQGTVENQVKADKRVFIKVEADGYLPYFTEMFRIYKNKTYNREIILETPIEGSLPSIEYFGLFNTDGEKVDTLKNTEVFYLKYKVSMPSNSSNFNFTFRAGSLQDVKDDIVFILPENSSLGVGVYYQKEPFNVSGNFLESKLVNLQVNQFPSSTHEITIPIRIRNAKINDKVFFFYAASINPINYMTHDYQVLQYFVEATSLCSQDFCFSGQYVDIEEGLRYDIGQNKLVAMLVNSDYLLEYTITNASSTNYPNSRLSVRNLNTDNLPTSMINIKSYDIFGDFSSSELTSPGEGNYKIPFFQDEIFANNFSAFSEIDFNLELFPTILGQSKYTTRIVSSQEIIHTLPINFTVSDYEKMTLDYSPKNIVPGAPFTLIVTVKDSKEELLKNVNINVLQKINNNTVVVKTGYVTNENGEVQIPFSSLRPNETFIIEALKSKYFAESLEFTVKKDILDVYKDSQLITNNSPLDVSVHRSLPQGETYTLTLENKTDYPVTLKQIEAENFSFNNTSLINFAQTVNYINNQISNGFVIEPGMQKTLEVKFSASDIGRTHPVTEEIIGSFSLVGVLNNIEYYFNVPTKIKLSVGDGVFQDDCLVISSGLEQWNTVIFNAPQTEKISIRNTCLSKEGQVPISVKNVQAKIKSTGDRFGYYTLKMVGPGSSSQIQLSENYYRIVIDEMRPEEEYEVFITYNPNGVKFADVKTEILFNAQVETETGLSFVNSEPSLLLKTDLALKDLSECFSYIDSGKKINTNGLFVLEGIEEKELTIRNECVGNAVFEMNLCENHDYSCRDLAIENLDEDNVLRFSLTDSEKTVSLRLKDSTKAYGAYILNNKISIINNFQRPVASSYALLRINAKDPNGLWTDDPFIEVSDDKESEIIRLYNNNLEKTPWHYFSENQEDFTNSSFNKNNYYLENIEYTSYKELSFSRDASNLLGIQIGSGSIIFASILAKMSVLPALMSIPVYGWIASGVLLIGGLISPSFKNTYDIKYDFAIFNLDPKYSTNILKKINLADIGTDQNNYISILDISSVENFSYIKKEMIVDGKLIKKKEFTNTIDKCPKNTEFVEIYNDFTKNNGCEMDVAYEEKEDVYSYKIKCSGSFPKNKITFINNIYLVCKNNSQVWPEQVGIKPLKIILENFLYNQLNQNSDKYSFKNINFIPSLNDSNNNSDFNYNKEIGNYRFGLFLTQPKESPNYDLSLQDCITDTGKVGKTGPGAVPNVSLDWEWDLQDTEKCSNSYCDATQLSQVILNRINKAEELISSRNVSCPKSVDEIINSMQDGSYIVNSNPANLENEIPVNKSGIKSVYFYTEDNLLKIKVNLENRNLILDTGSLYLKLNDYTPLKIERFNNSLNDFEEIDIQDTISVLIEDQDYLSVIYTFGDLENPIVGEDITLNVSFNSPNKSNEHSSFISTLDLSLYEHTQSTDCKVPSTTFSYGGTSYLDMWLNAQMYPDNVTSGWNVQDITTLKELLEFDAYLITDKYNNNFINDFDRAYGGLASKEDGTGVNYQAFMVSPTVFSDDYLSKLFKNNLTFIKMYSQENNNVNIESPGKYKVKIDFVFDNSSWKFNEETNPDLNAFVTFRYISSPETDSIFYRLPFNGFVGKSTSGYNRQGYGVSYTGDVISVDGKDVVSENDFGSNALRTINITKRKDLGYINSSFETRGNILNLEYKENLVDLILSPSTPIPVMLKIKKTNTDPLNVYYRLLDSSENTVEQTSLLRWSGVGTGCDFSNIEMYNSIYYDRFSAANGPVGTYVLDWPQVIRTGQIYLKSLFYLPEGGEYTLENRSDIGVEAEFSLNANSYSKNVLFHTTNVSVNSLRDVFNMVEDNKVCVVNSVDGKTSEFFYNPSQFYPDNFLENQSGQLECS